MSVASIEDELAREATSVRQAVRDEGERYAASQYRLVKLVAELDQSEEWAADGAPTCAHWVADALDVMVCTAREWLRVGRALAELEVIDRAFADGRVSYSKVRAVTRLATPETQLELCALAERIPAGRLGCALAGWLAARETPEETETRQRKSRGLWWRVDVDGTIVGGFRLVPADAAVLTTTVDAFVRKPRHRASADASRGEPWPALCQQRADALVTLLRAGGAGISTEIILHVRADGCTLDDGTPIAGTLVERIAPDSFIRLLIHDAEGRPINASGRQRHPTARQRIVVRERDQACVDCGSRDLLTFDHKPPFESSQRTLVDELELRCAPCHWRRTAEEVAARPET
jgi:hypothetical protein